MKPLVIYHANCADGFGAAFAAWLKLGDAAEYIPANYGDDIQYDFRDRNVYILDFSYTRERMDFLFEWANRVVWLDHHKTAFKDHGFTVNGPGEPAVIPLTKHDVILDNNKSGAYLAWEYFHPGTEVPMLIKHIDDYDRWQFKIEGTKAFNKALWSYAPWNFAFWRELNIQLSSWDDCVGKHFIYKEGEAILRAHEQNVQSVVKGAAMKCEINRNVVDKSNPDLWEVTLYAEVFQGRAANCPPHLTSDVGHELANQSGTFGLCWYLDSSGVVRCSLRSNGDYDVSAIARSFGGGGHRNAAGFSSDIQTLMGWLK